MAVRLVWDQEVAGSNPVFPTSLFINPCLTRVLYYLLTVFYMTAFFIIFIIHLLLAFFHLVYSFRTDYWQCYVRAAFCLFIALSIYLFQRKGFSVSILIYAYTLLYFNNFYNYTSFVLVIFSIIVTPKLTLPALVLYGANLIPALVYRQNELPTIGIHVLNCAWITAFVVLVIMKKAPGTLQLTEEERLVLAELADGKLQKEIKEYSENQVTQIIKNAVSRNQCKSKAELLNKYIRENHRTITDKSQDA